MSGCRPCDELAAERNAAAAAKAESLDRLRAETSRAESFATELAAERAAAADAAAAAASDAAKEREASRRVIADLETQLAVGWCRDGIESLEQFLLKKASPPRF